MIIDRHLKLSEASPSRANLASKFLHALFNHTISRYKDESGNKILNIKTRLLLLKKKRLSIKLNAEKAMFVQISAKHGRLLLLLLIGWVNKIMTLGLYQSGLLFLLALTGFRRSEAEAVEWKNVDLQFGTIKIVNTKTMKIYYYLWVIHFGTLCVNVKTCW